MKSLAGKVALITGASRGIGLGIARVFAAEGADIAFTYLSSEEKARALETELKTAGIRAKGYKSDAGNYAEAEKLINDIIADFGDLEVIVNNAGITKDGLLLRMSEEQWDAVINTNLKSVYNITKHAARHLMKQRKGSIINMSSVVGRDGNAGQANYSASKAGVIGFTQAIAKELGSRNIRCNAIAPGFIQTEMTDALDPKVIEEWNKMIPLGRPGTTEDVADLTVFLASDRSKYITGQVINVCGGLQM
jgi:3-oxoacyl-[acyl-carrier protein] reductase